MTSISLRAAKVSKRGRKPRKADSAATTTTEVAVRDDVDMDPPKASSRQTPYQRMKAILATKAKDQTNKIVVRMKLLWIADHRYGNRKLVRLHFGDAEASKSLDDLLSVFKAPYEVNREDIDSLLLTATIWNMESDLDLLPSPRTVVDTNEYSNLQLYHDTQCQLTARLTQMAWPNEH
ncbi:hypothetical protein ON010_g901 [Phytophthora cinnamomi]|nr:hypothetical protein ON010_g901 [Phytophthora cinnamomi]